MCVVNRMPRQRGPKPEGFTGDEHARLQSFVDQVDPLDRLKEPRFFSREANIAAHKLYGCRWWRRGEGQLGADGDWVESPALVMEKQI